MNKKENETAILNETHEALVELLNNFNNNEEALDKLIETIKEKGKLDEAFFVSLQER